MARNYSTRNATDSGDEDNTQKHLLHPIYHKVSEIAKKNNLANSNKSNGPGEDTEAFPTAHLTVRQHDLDSALAWTLQVQN